MPLQEIDSSNARALQDIADTITKSHKILVVTGAGISTSCGIPDFRSKDGLYNLIPDQHIYPTPPCSEPSTPRRKRKALEMEDEEPPSSQHSVSSQGSRRSSTSPASRMKGQDLFHARVFQNSETTEVFYQFIASLRQKIIDDVKETSMTHKFIRTLRDGGRLMRCYTQNIDGLEAREGLCMDLTRGKGNKRRFMKKHIESPRPERISGTDFDGGCEVVQLHGELTRLRCTMCSAEEEWTDEATESLLEGTAPVCEKCDLKSQIRQATGKRGLTVGGLRPNIVLYGEEHPQNTLLSPFVPYDISSNPDTLIIMGTSLKVHGLQKIIRDFAKTVHAQKNGRVIFVNRTRPAESVWDGIIDDFVAMDCDAWVNDLKIRREDLWFRQGELNLKGTKSAATTTTTTTKKKRKSSVCTIHEDSQSGATRKKQKTTGHSTFTVDIPPLTNKISKENIPPPTTSKSTKYKSKQAATLLQTPSRRACMSPKRPLTWSPMTPPFSPLTPHSAKRNAVAAGSNKQMITSRLHIITDSPCRSSAEAETKPETEMESSADLRGELEDAEKAPKKRSKTQQKQPLESTFVGRLINSLIPS